MKVTQQSSFLLSLVSEVQKGNILPAAMQRPYVWGPSDVEALCDSILHGFPIGSFLLWAPGAKADLSGLAKGRLGPISPETMTGTVATGLLLDGQNRLATMAWMLQNDEQPEGLTPSLEERETWLSGKSLVLDFDSQSVKFVPREEANIGLRLPAWTLLSSVASSRFGSAMQLIRKKQREEWSAFSDSEADDFIRLWDRCCDKFRDARTTVTVIEEATADEARHAFMRICRVGVPMAQADFDFAVGWQAPSVA